MLSEDPVAHAAIVAAMRVWHQTGALPVPAPAGMAIDPGTQHLVIDYGYNGAVKGQVAFLHGQYEMCEVTNATGGALQALASYNHSGEAKTLQNYIDALKSTDLGSDQTLVSRIINMTSECARSALVEQVIQQQLNYHGNLDAHLWSAMAFVIKNYDHTATTVGYNIQAGGAPWAPLIQADYLAFVNAPAFTGSVPDRTAEVNDLAAW